MVGSGSSYSNADVAQDNLSFFYGTTNPFNGFWDSNIWNFTDDSLPHLLWQENPYVVSEVQTQSTASLFPIGGMVVSLLLILAFLFF